MYDDGQDGMMMDEDWAQDDVERDGDTPSQDEEGHVEVSKESRAAEMTIMLLS